MRLKTNAVINLVLMSCLGVVGCSREGDETTLAPTSDPVSVARQEPGAPGAGSRWATFVAALDSCAPGEEAVVTIERHAFGFSQKSRYMLALEGRSGDSCRVGFRQQAFDLTLVDAARNSLRKQGRTDEEIDELISAQQEKGRTTVGRTGTCLLPGSEAAQLLERWRQNPGTLMNHPGCSGALFES